MAFASPGMVWSHRVKGEAGWQVAVGMFKLRSSTQLPLPPPAAMPPARLGVTAQGGGTCLAAFYLTMHRRKAQHITNVQHQPFKGGAPKKKVFDGHLRLDPCPRTEKRALLGAPPRSHF